MNEGDRRSRPRIWNSDWLILRSLAAKIETAARANLVSGSRIIDLGCGSMPYRDIFTRLGVVYVGADLGRTADVHIDECGKADLPDACADALLSVQVLEHVRNLDAYCSEMRRLLKPDGVLLLSTHGNWLYHPHPEDHRRWTRTGLVEDLGSRGFEIIDLEPIVGPLATTTLLRLTGFTFVLRKLPMLGRFLAGALAIAMNLRALAEDTITPVQMRRDNACVYFVRARKVRMS